MQLIKNEIRVFLAAVMFFTRIPVPHHNTADLNRASRYLPLVGIIVGLIGVFIFSVAHFLFKDSFIAAFLSLGATLLATGAFHEDGLADVADGFGGGWTKVRILEIMKDSQVGAFGVIALIIVIGLKICLVARFADLCSSFRFGMIFISAHSVSRIMPIFLLRFMQYSREDDTSKIKPLATKISWSGLICAIILGILPLFILVFVFHFTPYVFLSLVPCGLLTWYLARYFNKWINGYTGDCLGAIQQLNEILFYLSILLFWSYSS
ncbi:cobalamin-5'-phosphate synthase [Chitinophaga sp. CF118]|uniref:adenosylcobinamide-GDP ribazoletransferase n=1 Tax=Chitinophaga sp. CF118 TaxID=1884367 RepID=UPI0008F04E34|nr:adenosylcobinamide-GDP ribazoletransferase [Chitinophaga sp. CF118]SFD48559.1 cobalamin-5'-phosphate synthase [Chitinophaga sp. CF118]